MKGGAFVQERWGSKEARPTAASTSVAKVQLFYPTHARRVAFLGDDCRCDRFE